MKRLINKIAGNEDKNINKILTNPESKNLVITFINGYCEDHLNEFDDDDLDEQSVNESIEEYLRDDYHLDDFVELFLDEVDSDEEAEEIYNSKKDKEKLAEELFSKYHSEIAKEIIQDIKYEYQNRK